MRTSSSRQNPSKPSRNLLFFALLLLFFYLLANFLNKRYWLTMVKLKNKKNLIKKEILALNEENKLLREKIEKIRYNPLYIEKIAREDLGMVKPGEIVYKTP